MKALILAGGRGTRLRPLTYTSAKQLIPIANKPTVVYGIEAIVEAGITDIGIIVGDTRKEIVSALGDGSRFGANFTYIEQDAPRGLAHAVQISEDFMDGEPFLMYLGDNIVKAGVTAFVDNFRKHQPNAMVLLNAVTNPQQYGVVELKNGKVCRLVEKPKHPKTNLALVGVYLFDSTIFKAVNAIQPSWRNEYEITDAIQWLVDQDLRVDPHIITGWWKDTGKPEDMLEANRIMLEKIEPEQLGEICSESQLSGSVMIGKGSKIRNSILRGPIIIGEDSQITDAYIGPFTSIGDQVTIEGAEVENSILMDEVVISQISDRIDNSLVGRGAKVYSRDKRPKAISLVLGDCSQVEI